MIRKTKQFSSGAEPPCTSTVIRDVKQELKTING